jgi:hypothetical protein
MNDYEAIAAYAAFALIIFAVAMLWRKYRATVKKRLHLIDYRPKGDDPKTPHPV